MSTSIGWVTNPDGSKGETWNPVRGCTKVSPGCKHCYAETFAERWRGIPGHPYEQGFDLRLAPHKLVEPLHWTKPRTVFVNSMSDLFHEDIPDEYIQDTFEIMRLASWHTFQVLTKRAPRMSKLFEPDPLDEPHIWLGVSVEDRAYGLPRIDNLWRSQLGVKFLSIEPLLEQLHITASHLVGVDWVIVGGESGHGARPMQTAWVDEIRLACEAAGVPFFFKQWGAWRPNGSMWRETAHGQPLIQVGKKKAGRILHGRTWDAMPDRQTLPCPPHAERQRRIKRAEEIAAKWADHKLTWRALVCGACGVALKAGSGRTPDGRLLCADCEIPF